MKNNKLKYKIVVLSNLNDSTSTILKSAVSLAKMIDGDINFFHVKKPTDIIEKDNQLSAMRTINKEYNVTNAKIKTLIDPIAEDYGVPINFTFTFGNVKNEIETYIKTQQPDIIVLGKRKSKSFNFTRSNITDFVLKQHRGAIMITADNNVLEPNSELSLGLLNTTDTSFKLDFASDLLAHTKQPLKSFKIAKDSNKLKEIPISKDKKMIEYVFEKGDNPVKILSSYLSKNNINLLYVNREKTDDNANLTKPKIKNLASNLNVSLLLTGDM